MNKAISISLLIILIALSSNISFAQKRALKIDSLLTSFARAGQFNGTALVAYKGNIIYQKAFGISDYNWNIPNKTYTKYLIGDITKTFTAVLTAKFINAGKINLDSSIYFYTKVFPESISRKISIEELLGHGSGLPNNDFIKIENNNFITKYSKVEDYLKTYNDSSFIFQNGKNFLFSHDNYDILGKILEEISGKSYDKLLADSILIPLGMNQTSCLKDDIIVPYLANPYFSDVEGIKNALYEPANIHSSSWAIYSTVEDLYKFDRGLYSDSIINQEFLKTMYTPAYGNYGLGWELDTIETRNSKRFKVIAGHYSYLNGYSSAFFRSTEDQHTIILLDNQQNLVYNNKLNFICESLFNIIYNKPFELAKMSLATQLINLSLVEGLDATNQYYFSLGAKEMERYYYLKKDDLNFLSVSLCKLEKYKESKRALQINASLYPRYYKTYHFYGYYYFNTGDYRKALKNFETSVSLNPKQSGEELFYYKEDLKRIREINLLIQ